MMRSFLNLILLHIFPWRAEGNGKKTSVMNDFGLTGAALHYNPEEHAEVNVYVRLNKP